jgi:hypothetical protein
MRHWTTALGSALGSALLLANVTLSPAFAWPERLAGRPSQLDSGNDRAYYIWTDDSDTFHLSTTTATQPHNFRAIIRTDGNVENVDQARLEDADTYTILDGGHTLVVDFHTDGHIDNIRWDVNGGTFTHFNLNIDGHDIDPDHVFLGQDNRNPERSDFAVRR